MIEAFKRNNALLYSEELGIRTRVLMKFNLLFPFVDLAVSLFYPIGILLCILGCFELVGPLTLMLLPLSLLLLYITDLKLKKACRYLEFQMPRRSFLAFLGYIFVYQILLSPICFIGYLQEIFYQEKTW